ncbi:MAG: glycosyltransferase family 4 protein [Pseudonocardia sp.]|nr:glycosyltransferase family 4 protein [Pseudonocardia sp.]
MAGRVLFLNENESVPFDTRVWQECLALREDGWDVHVICPLGDKEDSELESRIDGISIYRYPLRAATGGPWGYAREYGQALFHTYRLARRIRDVDVVHASNPPDLMFLVAMALKRRGARFIFDHHDVVPELYLSRFSRGKDLLYRGVCWLERRTFATADVVIATNESYREVAIKRGRVDPERIFVVRNAPRGDRVKAVMADQSLARGKPYLLCYLGTMGPQDGVDYAIRALSLLRDDIGRQDWHAAFIGGGDCVSELRTLTTRLGLDSMISFTGRICDEELMRYLSTADVCMAPDPLNPLNNVSSMTKIIEYMTVGKPIVSFDLRETRFTAADAASYAQPNSELDFARMIAELLDDPERRRRMGLAGQARAQGMLSWETSRRSLLAAYQEVMRTAPVP